MFGAQAAYLSVMPSALIAVSSEMMVTFLNQAAEILLGVSSQQILGKSITTLPAFDDELCDFCQHAFITGKEISLFEQLLRVPMDHRTVSIHITPIVSESAADKTLSVNELLITIEKADGLDRLAGSVWKQEATRAAGVMAAMLAHEVKNPLSGIRGAAQLLKEDVTLDQQPLAELICMETDRIRDLLSKVEVFANCAVEHKQNVNIHEVLQYVISIAKTGFAHHVKFKERYDPSLPEVLAHRDLLVQMFLNLVKNSAEVLAENPDATITISTNYRSGYRFCPPRQTDGQTEVKPVSLPVMVTIEDNGSGIPESIREHLFEPFVSSKEEGRGLGLAVVAKIASDLGIVVELDNECDKGTRFNVWLSHA